MISTSKKELREIDSIKFLMAIFVVAIHTHPFEGLNDNLFIRLWHVMENLAVPYFFITSGFFLFSKFKKEPDKSTHILTMKAYGKRIIMLYLYWTIIFLPITIWGFLNNGNTVFNDFFLFLRGVILIGENYYSWPLWYLLAMIYSLIFICILLYLNRSVKAIFIISICVFIVSILINLTINSENPNHVILLLHEVLKSTFGSGRLFSGMLYIMIGGLFANYKLQLPKWIWILFFILGSIFQVFKFPLISSLFFVSLPTVLFYISINIDLKILSYPYFFRKSSTVMYFTHMIIFFLYTLIFKDFQYFGWDAFLVAILIPILLTPFIIKYEIRYPILKKIF